MVLNIKNCLVILLSLSSPVSALYEDQIGKFDWRQQYVGRVTSALFDASVSNKRVIVSTDQNVVAALTSASGKIQWRHILRQGPSSKVHKLLMNDEGKVIVISGTPTLCQGFESSSGLLLWEWMPSSEYLVSILNLWTISNNKVIQVSVISGESKTASRIIYEMETGEVLEVVTILIPWFSQEMQCELVEPQLVCFGKHTTSLYIIDTQSAESQLATLTVDQGSQEEVAIGTTKAVRGSLFFWLKTSNKMSVWRQNGDVLEPLHGLANDIVLLDSTVFHHGDDRKQYIVFLTSTNEVIVYDADSSEILSNVSGRISASSKPFLFVCHVSKKQQGSPAFHFLASLSDDSLIYGIPTDVYWTREESLSSILKVEVVDLPVSATQASIEEEFSANSLFDRIVSRISSQFHQLIIMANDLANGVHLTTRTYSKSLVRDRFGLHKLILVVTKIGKILALDTISGHIIWQHHLPASNLETNRIALFIQRTSIHYPLEPQCSLIFRNNAGKSSMFVFNPVTGSSLHGDYIILPYLVQQAIPIPQNEDSQFLKPLLLFGDDGEPRVFPQTDWAVKRIQGMAEDIFLFTADSKACTMTGYALSASGGGLTAAQVWRLKLCPAVDVSAGQHEEIVNIAARHSEEKVHSLGRVLTDRNVLFKYLNPNLVVVTTQGWHAHHRGYANIYLIDVVSGSVVFSATHRRVLGRVHVVYAENWVVYSYYNDKFRRTEVASLELFEGRVLSNSSAFSSFSAPHPIVDRQAYIYPAHITAMKDTFSEKGMTAKHILLGLSNGWIQELPRVFLDPRRPLVTAATSEMREEGIMPYIPELPIPPEAIVNYNLTALNIRGIYTAPSALESTCLVFAYGLDIFFTHVTPSRTFDVLSEDFEYFFIAVVLVGLTVASLVTKRLAAKKNLRHAWK